MSDEATCVPLVAVRDDLGVDPNHNGCGGEFGDVGVVGSTQQDAVVLRILTHVLTDCIDDLLHLREVLVVGNGNLDERVGPPLRLVRHRLDLAVADVPDHTPEVANTGVAQGGLFHLPEHDPAEFHRVSDSHLILKDHGDAVQVIRDVGLGSEAEDGGDDGAAGDDGSDVHAERAQDHHDGDRPDDDGQRVLGQRPECVSPLALSIFHERGREFIVFHTTQLTRASFGCAAGHGENRSTNGATTDPLREERDDEDDDDPKNHSGWTCCEYVLDQVLNVAHVVLIFGLDGCRALAFHACPVGEKRKCVCRFLYRRIEFACTVADVALRAQQNRS